MQKRPATIGPPGVIVIQNVELPASYSRTTGGIYNALRRAPFANTTYGATPRATRADRADIVRG